MKKMIATLSVLLMILQTVAQAALPDGYTYITGGSGYEYEVTHAKGVAHTGRASLKLMFSKPYQANTYVRLSIPTESLQADTTYRIEYYTKAVPGYEAYWVWFWDWDRFSWGKMVDGSTDWTLQTIDFTPSKSGQLLVWNFDGVCNFYVDDIEIYELDENGEKTGPNLAKNGDFETGDFEPASDVCAVETEPFDGGVVLSWENPEDSDYVSANIYMVDEESGEEKLLQNVVPKTEEKEKEKRSSAVIDGLENGKLYHFIIRTLDTGDNLSEGVKTFGLPVIDEYYASEIKADLVDAEGELIEEKIEVLKSGKIKVSASVSNNTSADEISANLICAVYRNEVLISVESDMDTTDGVKPAEPTVTITVPEELTGCKLYTCVWDNNLKTLIEPFTLTTAE